MPGGGNWQLDRPVVALFVITCLVTLAHYFGSFIVWGSAFVVYLYQWGNRINTKREKAYERLLEATTLNDMSGVETCHWLNAGAEKVWNTCLRRQIGPYLANLQAHMEQSTPGFIRSVQVEGIDVGTRAPMVTSIALHSYQKEGEMQFDAKFHFLPNAHMRMTIGVPHIPTGIPIVLYQFMMTGTARVNVQLNAINWQRTVTGVSLVGEPDIDFKVNILGTVNGSGIAGLYDWIQQAIHNSIFPLLVWPQQFKFNLEGDLLSSYQPLDATDDDDDPLAPIVDVGVVLANEETLPPGWEVVSRSVSGYFPADLNHGSADRELYLCYRRRTEKDDLAPIDGICLFFPEHGEHAPSDFTTVQLTVGGVDADLNMGGDAVYLAYSRGMKNPVRQLAVFNKTQEKVAAPEVHQLTLTPFGRSANVSAGKAADEIFLCVEGGAQSRFGFDFVVPNNSDHGLVRVVMVGAVNLKAPDVGGMCDAYCELSVTSLANGKETLVGSVKHTSVVKKATNPKWESEFVFRANEQHLLNVTVYDKARPVNVTKDTAVGVLKFPLDTLVRGTEVRAWYDLQLVSHGQALVAVEAVNFGLTDSTQKDKPLPQMDASKLGSRVRKMRAMADKIIRTNIGTGIVSKLPSNQVASSRDALKYGASLLVRTNTADLQPAPGGLDLKALTKTVTEGSAGENSGAATASQPSLHGSGRMMWQTEAYDSVATSGGGGTNGGMAGVSTSVGVGVGVVGGGAGNSGQGEGGFITKRAMLEKRSAKSKGKKVTHSKKFYVLQDGQLSYYRSMKDSIGKGPVSAIDLNDAVVSLEENTVIRIQTPSQELAMRATTETEAQDWVNALRHNIWILSKTSVSAPSLVVPVAESRGNSPMMRQRADTVSDF